jgi:subtilisin family serine protease
MRIRRLACAVVAWLAMATLGWGQTQEAPQYLLRVWPPAAFPRVCRTYGLQEVRNIGWLSLHVVAGPRNVAPDALMARVRADHAVWTFEPDQVAVTGENGETAARRDLVQTTQPLDEALAVDRTVADFYGVPAWNGYAHQPALAKLEVETARAEGRDGEGITVAVIDSGVDPDNPLLRDVLLPGYDFVQGRPGASEWGDNDQTTAAILDANRCKTYTPAPTDATGNVVQSTAAILDSTCKPGLLTQSTAAILDGDPARAPGGLPVGFGHGTMVAGLVHSVAPRARILPLKAFSADGTGRSSDIAQAIYYAVMSGARVLNLSFTFESLSEEVKYATAFAALQGAIVVAAAGNDGLTAPRWPAEHDWVVGVGATTLWDTRAPFSNQGYNTFKIGAPGVDLVTTYPGGAYAAVSGTSFSTPLVSGAVALMRAAAPRLDWGAAADLVKRKNLFAEIADVARNTDRQYPQRIIVPPAVETAEHLQRPVVKQIKSFSETP